MSHYVIGLTGGVASGKSAVARCFDALGVAVIDADVAAREAVSTGSAGLAEVVAAFGDGVLDAGGALDRAAMRQRIFDDAKAKTQLEAIVHPRVRIALREAAGAAASPYAVVAIPLLAESGGREAYPWLDRILLVDSPATLQAARLLQRDAIDAPLAERMIAAQASRQERLAIADDIVVNDGALAVLGAHVAALDRQYRVLAALPGSS